MRNIGHGEIFRKESTKRIIGIQVRTHYNNKTYRIDDIAWDLSPQSEVRKADGKLFNFMDFFQDQYQVKKGRLKLVFISFLRSKLKKQSSRFWLTVQRKDSSVAQLEQIPTIFFQNSAISLVSTKEQEKISALCEILLFILERALRCDQMSWESW